MLKSSHENHEINYFMVSGSPQQRHDQNNFAKMNSARSTDAFALSAMTRATTCSVARLANSRPSELTAVRVGSTCRLTSLATAKPIAEHFVFHFL